MENPLSDYLVVGAESFNPNNRFIVLLTPAVAVASTQRLFDSVRGCRRALEV